LRRSQENGASLDHPAATQDFEAAILVAAFNDFQLDRQPDKRAREFWPGIAAVSESGADISEGPLDQTGGTVAILDICRDYLKREEVTFGVDEGVALNALNFLARIVTDRINGDSPFCGETSA
jgi:hypothetical protein